MELIFSNKIFITIRSEVETSQSTFPDDELQMLHIISFNITPLPLYVWLWNIDTNMLYKPCTSLHQGVLRSSSLRGKSWRDAMRWYARANANRVYNACMFHCGLSASLRSCFVPTNSFGMRLTRYAPARILWLVRADTPLWLLRIEPESEAVSVFLKRGGGAKSSAVKVPDLRSR